jgi:hypothetical protein
MRRGKVTAPGARDEQGNDQLVERGDEGEKRADQHARTDQGQRHLEEGAARRGPQAERRLLEPRIDAGETGAHAGDDEGHGEAGMGDDQSGRGAYQAIAREGVVDADRHDDAGHDQRRQHQARRHDPGGTRQTGDAEGCQRAEQSRHHDDGGGDPDAEPGRPQPVGAAEVGVVPFQAEGRWREGEVGRRGERHDDHHQDREGEEQQDQPDDGRGQDACPHHAEVRHRAFIRKALPTPGRR